MVDDNTILSNSIYGNAGLGINLGSGPTPNHAPGTPGPNDYQNYPVISLADNDGTGTTIQGTLFESPNTSYLLQFFSSPQADPSGYGQGKVLIGSMNVTTDANGNASFTAGMPPATAGAYVSATATDPAGNTSEFSSDVAVAGQINLVLTGTATPNPVPDGANLTYALTVTNSGVADAHSVILSDQVPSGVSIVSVSPSQGYESPMMGNGPVTVMLGTIAAGSSATVDIVVRIGANSLGTITDTASVTSQESDPDPAAESTSITATVETAADVAVALAQSPSPVLAGRDMTYTMTVTNNGPQAASNVVANLSMAAGMSSVSAASTVGTVSFVGGQAVANLGNLADGAQAVVTVVLQATLAGNVTETATVSSDALDADLSNNTSSVTTQVDPACDLVVQVTADTAVAASGVPFNYTVTVTNNGPCDASGVVLSDTLPAGVTYLTALSDSGVTPAETNGVVSATFATLPAGSSGQLVIAVNPTAAPGATLVDSATAVGQQADPDPDDGTATLSVPVRGVSNLVVSASASTGSARRAAADIHDRRDQRGTARRARCRPELHSALRPGRGFDHLDPGRGPAGEPGYPPVRPGVVAGRPDRGRDHGRDPRQLRRGYADDRILSPGTGCRHGPLGRDIDRRGGRRRIVRPSRGHRARQFGRGRPGRLDLYRAGHERRSVVGHRGHRDDTPARGRDVRLGFLQPGRRAVRSGRRPHGRPGDDRLGRFGHRHSRD